MELRHSVLPDEPTERSIGLEIRHISNLIRRNFDSSQIHREMENMTGVHGWLLGYIANHSERSIYQKDIEATFSMRRSTATTMLQLMEKNDLIRRESVNEDKRLKRIVLTEKAKQLHSEIEKTRLEFEAKMSKGLSPEELETFFRVADKIKNNIELDSSKGKVQG